MEEKRKPEPLKGYEYRFDSFDNGEVLLGKKKNHLPAMGWNSWNAFGSGNTEALTKAMVDKIKDLSLDVLGYEYIVLDDGCYKPVRVDGVVSNEEVKFPSGFKALSDYIHSKGLKFGMYNDIGTNLCAGAEVGTYGHEDIDAKKYIEWGIDFIKVDNCYYLFDNATFSDAANAGYVYAPNIKSVRITVEEKEYVFDALTEGKFSGNGIKKGDGYVFGIGTFDGTGPDSSPIGEESGELCFEIETKEDCEGKVYISYATDNKPETGRWLQLAVGKTLFYDDFVKETETAETFAESGEIAVRFEKGKNVVRIMNHRRQENTLNSYAALLSGLNKADPGHDVILSICEWGKTQPQNWGYKVGDSWRILNDITFRVGSDGDSGHADWESDYTTSVTSQYNKAVIMDEFSGLGRGWNDPDMMMIGMDGLTRDMERTHMTMWCMMNSPLMLGLDLRRVEKGDEIYNIIANKDIIDFNRDPLGIQAKRIYSSLAAKEPDKEYIRDNNRIDVLAKPLADGSIALSFINVSQKDYSGDVSVDKALILRYLSDKFDSRLFEKAKSYKVKDVWTKEERRNETGIFEVNFIPACGNITYKVTPDE